MSSSTLHAGLLWPAEALWEAVAPLLPGFTVEVLPSIDSTNSELMRRARAGQAEPVLLVAESQTAGRGRLGREWRSSPGDSLTFSLGLPLAPQDWSGLSLAVGVAVAEALQAVLPDAAAPVPRIGLKWPNDLWLSGDRKLGGILIETANLVGQGAHDGRYGDAHQATRYAVVGVGLNVRPRDGAGLSTPPGCLQELDAALDAPTALLRAVPALVGMLQKFERQGFAPVQPRFAARDVLRGRPVTLSDGRSGTALGVDASGALQVRTSEGVEPVISAEISVRPQPFTPSSPH